MFLKLRVWLGNRDKYSECVYEVKEMMMRLKPLLIQLVTKLHSTLQTKLIEKMCCFENQNNTKRIAYMLCKVKLPLLQAVSKLMAVLNNVEHYQQAEPA